MSDFYSVRILPEDVTLRAKGGDNLYELLRSAGLAPEAFCGGNGRCGKCTVTVNGVEALSCRTAVDRDLCVTVPRRDGVRVLTGTVAEAVPASGALDGGLFLSFDIGTTTVVCFLLDAAGRVLASAGDLNPQVVYGADVVSRLRSASAGTLGEQSRLIRECMARLIERVCGEAGADAGCVRAISVVGNPTMQQLFLGLDVTNLVTIPFTPALRQCDRSSAGELFPACPDAVLLTVPDVSGYVGADTVACVLSTEMYARDALTLLIDIGTNGEMVLGGKERLVTCATAAGPALEGANIRFGMRSTEGAIDRVFLENSAVRCHVIGGGRAKGICGSGLIDAVAVFLELGRLDRRGRILPTGEETLPLTDGVFLTQEDIREVQLAKSAVASGIRLMAEETGADLNAVETVYLAGAFGSFLSPDSACRIGLLPEELAGRIRAVGNAAGAGACRIACSEAQFRMTEELAGRMELLELASLPGFRTQFAKNMYFDTAGRA